MSIKSSSKISITVTSNNSQYGTVSGGGDYEYNANATISATPNEGYKFLYWSDGNEENPRLVVVLSDIEYTAVFEEIPPATGITNGYSWVDLGLPSGLKWATCNVGAENPWDYGDYFAWGETAPKSVYDWSTYLDGRITDEEDCGTSKDLLNGITAINGTQYDAARVNMGGSWRMPTYDEQTELQDNCYWEWTSSYSGKGVEGYIVYKVKSASDKGEVKYSGSSTATVGSYSLADPHIFLPAAGYRNLSDLGYAGDYGFSWSSSLFTGLPDYAYYLYFLSDNVNWNYYYRYNGLSVRAVVE